MRFCSFAVSAEDAATRSRVEQVRALLQQRAERRKARRLAKTINSTAPYTLPGKNSSNSNSTSNSNSNSNREHQHLMHNLLCSGGGPGEVLTAQNAGQQQQQDYENEQHSIEQVENTFADTSTQISQDSKDDSKSVEEMDTITNKESREGIKIRENNEQVAQDEQQEKKQQTQDAEQDAAKMVSLNSGAVVA